MRPSTWTAPTPDGGGRQHPACPVQFRLGWREGGPNGRDLLWMDAELGGKAEGTGKSDVAIQRGADEVDTDFMAIDVRASMARDPKGFEMLMRRSLLGGPVKQFFDD